MIRSLGALGAAVCVAILAGCVAQPPESTSGILDLSLASGMAVPMVGEWMKATTGAGAAKLELVSTKLRRSLLSASVPGTTANYSMHVTFAESGPYAIVVPSESNYTRIIVNGNVMYDRATMPPRRPFGPALFAFDASDRRATVELVTAPDGDPLENARLVPKFPVIGSRDAVDGYRLGNASAVVFQVGSLFISAVFVFVLFLFAKGHREFFGLTVFLLAAASYCLIKNITTVLPTRPDFPTIERVYLTIASLLFVSFAFLYDVLFPRVMPRAIFILSYVVPPVVAISQVFLPIAWIYPATIAWLATYGLAVVVVTAGRFHAGDKRARWFFPALLALTASVAASLAFRQFAPNSFQDSVIVEQVGLLVFVFVVAAFTVREAGAAFEEVDTLERHLTDVSATVRRFIPNEFLSYLNKNSVADLKLGDHIKKDMTIFFSDIRQFTELSERLTPEENFNFINSYLSRMVPLIRERGGFVDKYIGDAIMALFADEIGADQAVDTAIEMHRRIVEYNGHRAKVGYRPIAMGVGIHTGALMLGVVGVDDRMEGTVVSDAVNLASRLQSIAKAFNIGVVISEQSFKTLSDPGKYKYRFIGKVRVRGKAAPVAVFEILDGMNAEMYEKKVEASMFFEQGMLAYYQKNYAEAVYFFKRTMDIAPDDGAARFYMETSSHKVR